MRSRGIALMAMVLFVGCGGESRENADDSAAEEVQAGDAIPEGNDPCTLVSQPEMEAFLGPLGEPPYRVKNRQPSPGGDGCFYRARDGRNVTLEVDWEDGPMVFRMMAGMGGQVEDILGGRDISADTLEVPWDEVGMAFGQLVALKGNVSVQVDPLGSRLDLGQVAEIVRTALGRLDAPLRYNGGEATKKRGAGEVRSGDPCSLVTREEVEAAMGPLRADPHEAEDGSGCVFPVDQLFFDTPVDRELEVQWNDGFHTFGGEIQAMGMAGSAMAAFVGGDDMPELGEVGEGGEPWDERVTLLGGMITVVKKDVLLKIPADGMYGFDEEKALALLRAAGGRIR
ncbi:MAG: DUF3558 domain-containing protein [Longimicrobiales bacterium]|nr:DUF3558 domain-containing protein [Longimicrobiales bacterium]